MTRVAIVTPYRQYFGGVERVNEMLIRVLSAHGMDVDVTSREKLHDGIMPRLAARFLGLNRVLSSYFNKHIAPYVDAVICNGEFSLGVRHNRALNYFHGSYYGYALAKKDSISVREYNGLMRLAEQQRLGAKGKHVVAVSRYLASILERQGIKVDSIIENGINLERFKPQQQSKSDRCLFVGSSDYFGKGFDVLEQLAERGVGIDCVTAKRPANTRLGWLGNIPNHQLPEVYSRYKCTLLPSRFEACGLVALESMACGTPVVMTNVGVGPDLAQGIPAFVVDWPGDVATEMLRRIQHIELNYERYSLMGRDYVERDHCQTLWEERWLKLLEGHIGAGGAGRCD